MEANTNSEAQKALTWIKDPPLLLPYNINVCALKHKRRDTVC